MRQSDQTRQWSSWLWWEWLFTWTRGNPNRCCKNIHCKTKTYSTAGLNINVSTSCLWNGGRGTYFGVSLLVFTEQKLRTVCIHHVSNLRWRFVRSFKWQFSLFHTLSLPNVSDHFKITNSIKYIQQLQLTATDYFLYSVLSLLVMSKTKKQIPKILNL